MENFDQIFTIIAHEESIGLNLDILETGVINIIALVGILIYTGKDFLGSFLEQRKITIVNYTLSITNCKSFTQDKKKSARKRIFLYRAKFI